MDQSLNAYIKQGNTKTLWLWIEGTGSVQTLYEGQGMCYNYNYNRSGGAATDSVPERYNRIELPSSDNKAHFAGVLACDVSVPKTGTLVEVNGPGSVCVIRVAAGVSAAIGDETLLECTYTAGTFKAASNTGKGCANAIQTITGGGDPLQCLAVLQEGLPSVGLAD